MGTGSRDLAARVHIVEAIVRALDEPHLVLEMLLAAEDVDAACDAIETRFGFDRAQALAILDTQQRSLTTAERSRIRTHLDELRSFERAARDE
ncbi:hypothetical protein K8Z61_02240 [Nocardioides sp. TRM66260-LWL]|uniref:hypothetical protein n=1 Tax=Nocardioides sp. TRM66260-LWL TaxID=2874478 RepID=UPI001CC7F2E8|nr:hypothetical protein [Nocardioides sp. TRM66260-LWL]MBZ5733304.1 hypothetical protein [Nocardioides sp. TRM66260-LWL]